MINSFLAAFVLFPIILVWYSWYLEPSGLVIRSEKVVSNRVSLERPVRILFLSDLHFGTFLTQRQIEKKWKIIETRNREQSFDLVVFGGDYLDRSMQYLERLEGFLRRFQSFGVPVVGILGNHDESYPSIDSQALLAGLTKSGVRILHNDAYTWQSPGGPIVLIGIKDLESSSKYVPTKKQEIRAAIYRKRAEEIKWYERFNGYGKGKVRILIGHNPDVAYLPGSPRPDLILSGHTHGGQTILTDWLRVALYWMMPRGSFRSFAGRKTINGSELVVSRGFGGSLLPVRLLRKPEAVVIELS